MNLFYAPNFQAPLQPIRLPELVAMIRDPRSELADDTQALRSILSLDEVAYQKAKARLPHVIAATFSGNQRHTTYFQQIEGFFLDLDHLSTDAAAMQALKQRFWEDPRVMLAYVSPSGRGVKVLFALDQPIRHTKQYADGYQAFARQWAEAMGLSQHIDLKTHDVTRVSFLAHDPAPFVREQPEPVPAETFGITPLPWDAEPPQPAESTAQPATGGDTQAPAAPAAPTEPKPGDPAPDTFREIRNKLAPNHRQPAAPKPGPYVPEVLRIVGANIVQAGEAAELQITLSDIQYGLKVRVAVQHHWAELNLFHGKQGFSVVPTPKRGSNGDLAAILHDLVTQVLYEQLEIGPIIARLRQSRITNN